MLRAKDFAVKTVEAPVKYPDADGGYRPGYLDRNVHCFYAWKFYAWKGVALSQRELLDTGADGHNPVVRGIWQVLEIDMTPHLKNRPALWKKD